MNIRKHTIIIELAEKTEKMLLSHKVLKNNILPKFISLDLFVNSSMSRCDLDDLNKIITKKTRNLLSIIYKSESFLKISNSIKKIEDANLPIKNILEEIQVLTKGTPKKGTNKTITRLNKLITALENLLSNIDRMSQEYSNIDAYLTEKYTTSSLISKIENCELALNSLYENLAPFKDGVRFYTNNIKIIKSSSLKTRNTLTENLNQFNQTKELMEENNETIEQLHSLLKKSINKLNKLGDINKLSETLNQDSKKDSARALLKQDIDALIKLINITVEKHAALQNTMDESKEFAEKYKVKLESNHQKINDLLDGLDVCFHLIQEKYTDCNFTENTRIISQNIYKTSLISNALNKISTQIELLQHSINIDLIGVKQSLSQAKELDSTVDKLSNRLISLTNPYDSSELESETQSDSIFESDFESETQSESGSDSEQKSIPSSMNNSNPIGYSTQKQVKNYLWKTPIVSQKETLFEREKVNKEPLEFNTVNHMTIKTTKHVCEILDVSSTLEIYKVNSPNIPVSSNLSYNNSRLYNKKQLSPPPLPPFNPHTLFQGAQSLAWAEKNINEMAQMYGKYFKAETKKRNKI